MCEATGSIFVGMMLASPIVPFGYLAGGALVQRLPPWLIFAASALAILALALWIAGLKELRELRE